MTEQDFHSTGYPQLLERRHESTIWTRYATCALGFWLIAGVFSFSQKTIGLQINDALCGILLVVFGALSLQESRRYAPWAICLVGIWLQFSPLLFWASTSYGYINDTLVGVVAIALSVLIPGTPGLIESGPEVPQGWNYNPSSWAQRLPIIFLAFFAWLIARYMAAYQLGYIQSISDPLFGNGTLNVITSDISRAFPVSDAGLGACAYTIETLLGCKGGSRRWHSMPWIVLTFGFLVVPVGLVSIVLIMLQPLFVGYWCFWCLLTALLMLAMIALTLDEVMASIQYLLQAKAEGKPFWPTFWYGSAAVGGHVDTRSPPLNADPKTLFSAMSWGITVPWNIIASSLIGLWLMFTPPLFHIEGSVETTNHILGALIFSLSIVALAEVARALRYLNILFGLIVGLSPWLFGDSSNAAHWNNTIFGLALLFLSIRRGPILQQYGSLDKFIL